MKGGRQVEEEGCMVSTFFKEKNMAFAAGANCISDFKVGTKK
jgi:hypothetical protein